MADTTIRGINIEFGADDTSFNKSLNQINKELKSAATLGKSLDKALRFDPTSTELLNDRLVVTQNELSGTESKAEALRKELDRLDSLDTDQLNQELEQVKIELDESEASTKKLKMELTALDKAGQIDTTEYQKLSNELAESKEKADLLKVTQQQLNADIKNLDPVQYQNLQKNLINAESDTKKLRVETERLQGDIKALDTEQYKDLSDRTKQAAINTGDLTEEQVAYGKALDNSDPSGFTSALLEQASGATVAGVSLGSLTKLMNPYTAAVAGAVLVVGNLVNEQKKENEIQRKLAFSTSESTVSFSDQEKVIRSLAKVYNLELNEATALVIDAQKLFGDSLRTNEDLIEGFTTALFLQENGLVSVEEAQTNLLVAQNQFGSSAQEATKQLFQQVSIIEDYGRAADDILDTQREWGDLFSSLGASSDQFTTTLVLGLEAGAKETDEVANAFNELNLRLSEDSAELEQVFSDLGLSYSDTFDAINSGNYEEAIDAIVDLLLALEKLEEQQGSVTEEAGILFGTYGEEFIATFAGAAQGPTELAVAIERQRIVTNLATESTALLTSQLMTNAEQYGLTAGQGLVLAGQIEDLGLKTFLLNSESTNLTLALQILGESGALTTEQMSILTGALDIATTSGGSLGVNLFLAAQNAGLLDEASVFLNEKLGITDEKIESLNTKYQTAADLQTAYNDIVNGTTSATDLLNGKVNEQLEVLGLSESVIERYVSTTGYMTSSTIEVSASTATLTEKLTLLEAQGELSEGAVESLTSSYDIFTDTSLTSEERVEAFRGALETLESSTFNTDGSITSLKDATDAYTDTIDGSQNAFTNAIKSTEDSADAYEDYRKELDESVGSLDKVQGELEAAKTDLNNFGDSAVDAKNNMSDLNDQISTFNSNPPVSQSVSIAASSDLRTVPAVSQSGIVPPPLRTGTGTVNETPISTSTINAGTTNLSVMVNVQGKTEDPKLLAREVSRELAKIW